MDGRVTGNSKYTGVRVEVLVERELEDGRASLTVVQDHEHMHAYNISKTTYREVIVEYARKKTQMRYQRSPYTSMTFSLLLTQFLYHRQSVAE